MVKTVAEDREAAQEEISVHAGVGASYGAFSGEIQSDFDYSSNTTSDSYYCYWRSFNQLAILETNPDLAKAAISDDFAAAVAALPLPMTEDNQTDYFDFFALYGPFYTRAVTLGGDLSIFNEVTKSSSVTSASLEFSLKAQYDGLYVTGNLDLSGQTAAQWEAYRTGSNISIKGLGGDQTILNQLAGVDPWNFSTASADLATAWAKSLGAEPGLVDFALGGVWELIADPQRSAAVQEAWQLFAQVMHPRLSIQSWSTVLPWPCWAGEPRTPIVIGSKIIKPATPTTSPIGAPVTVRAGNDPVSDHAVQFNQYYTLPLAGDWSSNYATMWDQIATDVLGTYDESGNILLVVTFGLDANMPPTDTAAALLKTAGSRQRADHLDGHTCDPGSEVGTPGLWTGYPCVYAFVGAFGNEQGSSVEVVVRQDPAEVDLTVYLYREAYDGQYTIALG